MKLVSHTLMACTLNEVLRKLSSQSHHPQARPPLAPSLLGHALACVAGAWNQWAQERTGRACLPLARPKKDLQNFDQY